MNYTTTQAHDREWADDNRQPRRNPLTDEIRVQLEALRKGAKCEDCSWMKAISVWRGRRWCATGGPIAPAARRMDVISTRIHRTR